WGGMLSIRHIGYLFRARWWFLNISCLSMVSSWGILGRLTVVVRTSDPDQASGAWRIARQGSPNHQISSSALHRPLVKERCSGAGLCTQGLLRYLTKIQVSADNPQGSVMTGPLVTFAYSYRTNTAVPSPNPIHQQPVRMSGFDCHRTS